MYMKEQIREYLNRYLKFDEKEVDQFFAHLTAKTLRKKEYLLREGQVCHHKFFIVTGLVRAFYVDHKGHEKVLHFGIENWWVTDTESFVKEIPSQLNIQALEETTVLQLNKRDLEHLYQAIPKLERFFRIVSENMLIAFQRRSEFYMKLSSKQRYDLFIQKHASFAQRVPQYMIASYLEITPEHLSTLRKTKTS